MQNIVLASNNLGKVREFNQLLNGVHLAVLAQSHWQIESVPETGLTFVENALIKARHAAKITGLPALADDSGLEVDALGGAPGIYSARFAGEGASDAENNRQLLARLADVPDGARQARYQCVLVLLRHWQDPTPLICQAHWAGEILREPQGEGGFGYDPIFFLPSLGMTSAQLPAEEKHRLSHRGRAMAELLARLPQWLPQPGPHL